MYYNQQVYCDLHLDSILFSTSTNWWTQSSMADPFLEKKRIVIQKKYIWQFYIKLCYTENSKQVNSNPILATNV